MDVARRRGSRAPRPVHYPLGPARIVALALVATSVALLPGCASQLRSDVLALTGVVAADDFEIQVPSLSTPMPNVTVGLPSDATVSAAVAKSVPANPSNSPLTLLSLGTRSQIESMAVAAGKTVATGDVVAVMEHALLDADVRVARSAAAAAGASVRVIDQRLSDATEARSTLTSRRSDLLKTIADLKRTRVSLVSQLAQARAVLAKLDAIKFPSLPATLPPGPLPPGVPDPRQIAAQKALLEAQKAKLRAGIEKLAQAISKLDAGIPTAESGLRKLDEGRATLADARAALSNAGDLSRIGRDAALIAVDLAKARRDQAVVRSPIDGTIVDAAFAGDVLAAGAPLALIRRTTSREVETWVDVSEIERVRVGQQASVRIDSRPDEVFSARVTYIGTDAGFAPTSHATRIVHMIRAVPIRVTLDGSAALPVGTPADLTISTR